MPKIVFKAQKMLLKVFCQYFKSALNFKKNFQSKPIKSGSKCNIKLDLSLIILILKGPICTFIKKIITKIKIK